MLRTFVSATVVAAAILGLSSCGDDDSSGAPGGDTTPVSIEVTIDGETVTPSGERVQVDTGQPVELHVTADVAGELHVHSDPEQELEYDEGTSTVTIEPIDQPGVVDVEVHDLEAVVVQLEVS